MTECVFCRIVKGELPCFKIYEDERVLAFEDINPIAEGHTLIIPKRHAENLWEISGEDLAAIHLASKKVAHALREVLKPTGIAVLQLNGPGAKQVVLHYHLHLVPRLGGGPPLPITNWDLRPGDKEAIRKTAERIAETLRS
ncbi:MAG: HIT family protein [Desulfobacterota bacterium]|jgi:histidine triad (HIT) family protein|nr:HIT family protein [Thermodesulfobacteriota bacterium]